MDTAGAVATDENCGVKFANQVQVNVHFFISFGFSDLRMQISANTLQSVVSKTDNSFESSSGNPFKTRLMQFKAVSNSPSRFKCVSAGGINVPSSW